MSDRDWSIADRVSERIVAILNDELRQMRARSNVDSLQLLVGQLLAFYALGKMPAPKPRPLSLEQLDSAIANMLDELRGWI